MSFWRRDILNGEETFRYGHCGFSIHHPYHIILHVFIWWFSSSHVIWVYYCSVFFVTLFGRPLQRQIWIRFELCHRPWSPFISAWNGFPYIEYFVCLFIVLKVFRLRSFISVFGTSILVFVLVCLFESQQLVSFIVYLPNHAELSPLLDTMQAMKSVKSWKLLPSMIWSISILLAKLLSTQHTVKCFKWAQS